MTVGAPIAPDLEPFEYSKIMLEDISHKLANDISDFNRNNELNLLESKILETIFKDRMDYNQFGGIVSTQATLETSRVSINTYLKAIV